MRKDNNRCLGQLSLIYKANSSYEKVGVLTEFLDRYRMLQMLFRVCVEQKVITERKYASFGLLLEKIGKQATSWKQYNERGMKKQEDKRGRTVGIQRTYFWITAQTLMKEGMDMEKIHAVTTSLFGKGSIALLPEELKKRGLTRGLIVTDSFSGTFLFSLR